ncbi:hypothetical protein D3C72_2079490 [compost metagenome]
MSERPESHDFAHLDPTEEFSSAEPILIEEETEPVISKTRKDELFCSSQAMNFEKETIAQYDNVNIVRSQVADENLPDIASYFPSSEQSIPLPELNDHEYR